MNPQVWGKRRNALSPHEGVRLVTPANGVFSGLGASISDPLEEEDRGPRVGRLDAQTPRDEKDGGNFGWEERFLVQPGTELAVGGRVIFFGAF